VLTTIITKNLHVTIQDQIITIARILKRTIQAIVGMMTDVAIGTIIMITGIVTPDITIEMEIIVLEVDIMEIGSFTTQGAITTDNNAVTIETFIHQGGVITETICQETGTAITREVTVDQTNPIGRSTNHPSTKWNNKDRSKVLNLS
jgi:predicted transcriptional regulator